MRTPPAPTLQNVLVSHPSHPHNTVATPDDLVAAAVLAADDSHDISRGRNMLSRFSRRWARISDSLRRRRNSSRRDLTNPTNPLSNIRLRSSRAAVRSHQVIAPPVIKFDPSNAPIATSTDTDPSLNRKTSDRNTLQITKPVKQIHDIPVQLPPDQSSPSSHVPNAKVPSNPQPIAQRPLLLHFASPASSQVILSRERELRANRRAELLAVESAADDEVFDGLTASSIKEPNARRVRQVGAREDDDTLLQLPRVPSVSFPSASRADSEHAIPGSATASPGKSHPRPPKVRQLPRVSGLMPMRSLRAPPIDHTSPSSSAGRFSRPASETGSESQTHGEYRYTPSPGRSPSSSHRTSSQRSPDQPRHLPSLQRSISDEFTAENDHVFDSQSDDVSGTQLEGDSCDASDEDVSRGDVDFDDDIDDEDGYSSGDTNQNEVLTGYNDSFKKRPLYRLPTGMSSKDVEREMEHAVVEIASDGGESAENGTSRKSDGEVGPFDGLIEPADGEGNVSDKEDQAKEVIDSASTTEKEVITPNRKVERVVYHGVISGSRGPMKSRSRSDAHDERTSPDQGFLRRVSSSMRNEGSLLKTDFEGCTVASGGGLDKNCASRAQDVALFEDDYLSFQGFHNNASEGRTHYSAMTALLRPKRISSVTDSLSEESEEGGAMRMRSESLSRHGMLRSGRLPRLRRKWSALGVGVGSSSEERRM